MSIRDVTIAHLNEKQARIMGELHPDLAALVGPMLADLGGRFVLMQGFRPNAEQDADYAKGRTVRGAIVTGAKAGESPHNFQPSYAADVVLNPAVVAVAEREGYPDLWDEHSPDAVQAWADLEVVAAKYGLERVMLTGPHGPYRDKPHVQLHGWRSRIPH